MTWADYTATTPNSSKSCIPRCARSPIPRRLYSALPCPPIPRPALPAGLSLTVREGAGEVQTPLMGAATSKLDVGDPVFMRHAKAGELAEHFNEYLLVRGDQIEDRVRTYRGMGFAYL